MHERIGAINGLRGIAILGVVWHHLFAHGLTPPGSYSVEFLNFTLLPLTIFSNGWLGVNLFFILSGFVLFYPFALNRRKMANWSDCGRFYSRRARRLMPLFYFSLAVFIAVDLFIYNRLDTVQHLLLYITATFNFNVATYFPSVNWVLWSLGLEIWFSVLFPLLLIVSNRFNISRLLLLGLLLSLVVRIIGNQEIGANIYGNPIKDSIFGRLDDFLVGMWLCQLYRNPPSWRIPSMGLFGVGVLSILVVSSVWDHIALGTMSLAVRPFLNNLFQLGAVCIIYSLIISDRSRLLAWLSNRELQILGMMTYSVYIWHGRLILILRDEVGLVAWTGIVPLLLYLATLLVISMASYRFIEFWYIKDSKTLFRTPR